MNEEAARKLARYRVGEDQHMGKSMTADEIELRRGYVRNVEKCARVERFD